MIDFPSPILSVATEVVKDLDGEDAVYGMWTVFTKCKQSLKDGDRLENMSWRLWYREFAAAHCDSSTSPGSLSPPFSDNVRSPSPITPVSEDALEFHEDNCLKQSLMPSVDIPTAHSWHGENLLSTANVSRRLSTASMPARPRTRSGFLHSAGQLILDILPDKLVVPRPSDPSLSRGSAKPAKSTAVNPVAGAGSPSIASPRPVVALPTMQLPSTPPSNFPRVVVVNPTPHPTPPATPHNAHPPAVVSGPAPTHLLPPHPGRSLMFTHQTSVPAPMSSGPTSAGTDAMPPTRHGRRASGSSSRKHANGTSKAKGDAVSLQQCSSPDNMVEKSEVSQVAARKPADVPELSPSSGTSSNMKSDGAGVVHNKRAPSKARPRRSKDAVRHAPGRAAVLKGHAQRQVPQRRVTGGDQKKAAFNIGSVSSNGSRGGEVIAHKPPTAQRHPAVPKPRPPSPLPLKAADGVVKENGAATAQALRRGIVVSTSSEFETTDSDDDSEDWASEENSVEDKRKEKERQQEETRLREAAEEAQRQRKMFEKIPKRSYSNLPRTQSGLLSQLLNPDPAVFPPDHPYRTSYSTQDVTQYGRQGYMPAAPPLTMAKGAAAVPQAARVTAQAPATNGSGSQQTQSGYRPKGPPQGEELEDDSDSGDENPENEIQLSRSLAQQKLAALADPNRRRNSDRANPTQPLVRPVMPHVVTAPIPLGHPYNLPAPAPPMTPRTTRRQMLATELSESLRRNLLWERQVSKINMTGGARRGGLLGSGLRPLTAVNNAADGPSTKNRNDQLANGNANGNEGEERRRAAMARNRSWADDYHYSGW